MLKKTYNLTINKSVLVHDLPKNERPREKLEEYGAKKISNPELLAIILRTGKKGESAISLAQRLLAKFGSMENIAEASFDDLLEIDGLGPAKASQLQACFEIANRIKSEIIRDYNEKKNQEAITNPSYAVELIRNKITSYTKEHFLILSFDTRNKLLGIDNVTIGTLTSSPVHPRESFEAAIRRHAAQIIAAHNHPSGDCEPSEEDIIITKRLSEAGKIMGIELIDHIIVSKNGYFSFKEKDLI